ncbi:MAG: cytochrome c peroxidase [Pseudomonadota bacterium]
MYRLICALLLATGLLQACSPNTEHSDSAVADIRPWLEMKTTNSRYRVRIDEHYAHIPAGELHAWIVQVTTIDEVPLTPQRMKLSGTMPGHGHGMATFPQAVATEQTGRMRVDGMKFHMGGLWRMRIDINDAAGPDYAYFELDVQPAHTRAPASITFSEQELAQLNGLRLASLAELQADPSNRFSLNSAAAALGEKWFFDPGFSQSGTVSCATCHDPELGFGDGKALSVGTAITPRHAPTLPAIAHATWFYWDGRRDSLWAQALSPLETRGEMDNHRGDVLRYILTHPEYGPAFEQLTGVGADLLNDLDRPGLSPSTESWRTLRPPQQERINTAFALVGKVIAAYEETLQYAPTKFDRFVDALLEDGERAASDLYTESEMRGAKLFVNEEQTPCLRCHNGPLFTNQEFHNIDTGTNAAGGFDSGRLAGVIAVKADPFNCLGVYSDAQPEQCSTLNFARGNHLESGAFKTPSLRNIKNTAPYFHDGRMPSLQSVLAHYLASQGDEDDVHEMPMFELTRQESDDLLAFLNTL